jgi:flagellar hook-length control protein FliK
VELSVAKADKEMPGLLIRHAELAWRGGAQELRVRLRPPDLGEIRVAFREQHGMLRGSVVVEREDVRQWLEARVPSWREELADAGLKVDRLDVTLLPRGGQGGQTAPWEGGNAGRWAEGRAGQIAAPALADSPVAEMPVLGVNVASASGRIDYWA